MPPPHFLTLAAQRCMLCNIMRRLLLSCCVFLCLGAVSGFAIPAAGADTVAEKNVKKANKGKKADKAESPDKKRTEKPKKGRKKAGGKLGPVAAALKDLDYITEARPNLHAKQYKYMQAATWCTICHLKMQDMEGHYDDIRKQGTEIIIISADDTVEKAQAFMAKHKSPLPCVMRSCPGLEKLPHYRSSGGRLPDVFTVSAEGELLSDGSPMRGRKD